jgi:hypothetical protein
MLLLLLACTDHAPVAPLARVQACSTDAPPVDSGEPLPLDSAEHTGELPAPEHTGGDTCGAGAVLGWQVLDWVPSQSVNLAIFPAGSLSSVGHIEVPLGEEGDVCAATCSESWAIPVVSRPDGSCSQDPAVLPLVGVASGRVVQVCVAVYEPAGARRVAECEVTASGGVASFRVRAD